MAGIMMVAYALGIVAAAVVVWLAVHRRREDAPSARLLPVLRAARRRAVIAVVFATAVFIAGALAGIALPEMLGQPFAVAPLVAGAAGMLLYSATPPRQVVLRDDEPRAAQLVPRSALSAVPARWAAAFLLSAVAFLVLVLFCGMTAALDEQGRSRTIGFESEEFSSWSSPYPGWFYGVPALIALVLLAACTLIALQRISATPAFPRQADALLDGLWRRRSVEVILKLGIGAVLFSFGGIAATAGMAMGNAMIAGSTPMVWSIASGALWISGVVALVLSIVSVTLAGLTAVTIGEAATRMESVR
ncbi:hypothetical protein [Microbacterium saperdae]|uniref:Uncharacterized protein n=1 Tax=Microbacterium saperdae TaxID=69368 RepID=A0A543BKA9_9MICO|nr:hypothetical protein [Microbacterium saperdae]TQL85258.1 hypothetical protein FB560_0863 [Microbacterium saperdae]GGM55691.1 hypothetical protein GCM10010489_29100 [Microbacterium saperdae]